MIFAGPVEERSHRSEQLPHLAQGGIARELSRSAPVKAEDPDRSSLVGYRDEVAGPGTTASRGDRQIFRVTTQIVDGQFFLLLVDLRNQVADIIDGEGFFPYLANFCTGSGNTGQCSFRQVFQVDAATSAFDQ